MAVDAHGNLVRMFITAGTTADCTQAGKLVDGIDADNLIADKGYDSNDVLCLAQNLGMQIVIPPKKTGKCTESMTNISIAFGIWSRMLSYNSSGGAVLPHDMPKIRPPFWQQYISDVLQFGRISIDDTI